MEPAIGRPFYGFIPGADASGHQSIIPMADEGNWDDLPHELVSKVSEILLRWDVTDFVRLRTKLMGRNPGFFPHHWKMLHIHGEQARFVNVLTGASIRVKIPQDHSQVIASADGCLLLASATHKVCLFNLVTAAAADLPMPFFWIRANGITVAGDIQAAGIIYDSEGEDDVVPTPTVVLLVALFSIDMVKYARPGDTVWQWRYFAPNEDGELPLFDGEGGLSLGGRFYVPSLTGDVHKLELHPYHLNLRSYLVPPVDAGILVVVRRLENHISYVVAASHVFQVNLTEGTLTLLQEKKDIGNLSIFHRWLIPIGPKSARMTYNINGYI
ncbi:hypothetical protein VPH35_034056 [Triticum aestivum]